MPRHCVRCTKELTDIRSIFCDDACRKEDRREKTALARAAMRAEVDRRVTYWLEQRMKQQCKDCPAERTVAHD